MSDALYADLYQLTMAQAYWQSGKTAPATFSLYFRSLPPGRGYFVFAGLQDILDYLEGFGFSDEDIAYLRSTETFDGGFLDYLAGLRFTGSVRAMAEGAIFFPDEPVIEVSGPVIEAQLAETFLVNQANLQTLLATKASRVVHAAASRAVVDFAARRTQGTDAGNKLARACYMVGFAGTSNVRAGARYGIPNFGTTAHSFVTVFEDEADSFRAYGKSFPNSSTFLVDTYDTVEGVRNAIRVAKEMRARDHELKSIRLDSGELLELSIKARAMLDEAGFRGVQVFASGGLDEFEIETLLHAGAAIDGFGVGTKVGVSADAPWADCIYKLVEYDGRPVAKLSSKKETLPGPKQVYRFFDSFEQRGGRYRRDVIATSAEEQPALAEPLLSDVMQGGRRTTSTPSLGELRRWFGIEFARLPAELKALRSPPRYETSTSHELERLRSEVESRILKRTALPRDTTRSKTRS